jgi:CHAD domain-containing protein
MKKAEMHWKAEEPALQHARRVLPALVREYFNAGRKLDPHSGAKAMHRFRLKTKQIRYTLEAFVPLYGSELESRIARLRPIQNALGDLNDCEVLRAEMDERLSREVRKYLDKRSEEKREEFLQYWRKEFDAEGEDQKWEQYLTHPPRTRSPRTKSTTR